MRVLAFGTYDVRSHPRVQVLIDGLRSRGHEVAEANARLGLSTAERVRILREPWRVPVLVGRIIACWASLVLRSRRFRGPAGPDAVLIGYLGHFDVLLARALFPRTTLVLDHLIFAANTAADRGAAGGLRERALSLLDHLALTAADVIVVDTDEHSAMVPEQLRERAVVVPVGATDDWFAASGTAAAMSDGGEAGHLPSFGSGEPYVAGAGGTVPLSVVFFGLFTPLQGSTVIGRALRLLHERGAPVHTTLIGSGQDAAAVHADVDELPSVTWVDWVDADQLPAVVAAHDVCLGIFGTTDKALRVVPNKVYQGAAAGAAIVTSATEPQRRVLGDAAVLTPPGDAEALADALAELAGRPERVRQLRLAATSRASSDFTAAAVTGPLHRVLVDGRR
ncbi:glycosyltransferase [Georgenia sp. EYE_87]|uniref:glycosyltransferase n=1 Tax=Georgenia sp. EYE_87 TaxID=2853448 RepID=UPI0020036962|nr:glycosyltransferase [Georgenia sp. EYE_87]MCK6211780.1 glycosyltransferase [Georgenia sp. EYE_87]